ncbi:MAG: hypothetical protein H6Q14_1886 [Bacteroidetes bacterium]|nr:hypothetical protein [Bacteroidota bacterium]
MHEQTSDCKVRKPKTDIKHFDESANLKVGAFNQNCKGLIGGLFWNSKRFSYPNGTFCCSLNWQASISLYLIIVKPNLQ